MFFNPAAFSVPANRIGRFGNMRVGSLRGPGTRCFRWLDWTGWYLGNLPILWIGPDPVALVNQIRDPETVESNSFAGCSDMGNGFRCRLFPVLARRLCLGKGFKRASDDMFG